MWCGGDNSTGPQVVVVMQAVQAWWNSSFFRNGAFQVEVGGVLAVLWWLVGHRLRLAHKQRQRGRKRHEATRFVRESRGLSAQNQCIRPATSIIIQERPRKKFEKKKADHAMQG